MLKMGRKIDQFDDPVCNSFRPRVLDKQLCYEVDVNEYFKHPNFDDLKIGLVLILDYNEDRQMVSKEVENGEDQGNSTSFSSKCK